MTNLVTVHYITESVYIGVRLKVHYEEHVYHTGENAMMLDVESIDEIIKNHVKWLHSAQNDGTQANLSGIDLCNYDFKEVVLIMADLSGADLKSANLLKSNLKGANLKGAYLREAVLRGANLIDADLLGANLIGANLRDAFLRETNFREAHFIDADLRHANLIDANMVNANLRGADLRGATMAGVDLSNADLTSAKLRGVNFRGAKMIGANFTNADLSKCDFRNADLRDADLSGVDLREATFVQAQLGRVCFDDAELGSLNIDNDSYDQVPHMVREQFERTWQYLDFRDHSVRNYIAYSINLPEEYRSAAFVLIYYFNTILQYKHPEQKIKFEINFEGSEISLLIDIIEGTRSIVEKALSDYCSVISGSMPLISYTVDPVLTNELQNELHYVQYRIDLQREHIKSKYPNRPEKADEIKFDTFLELFLGAFRNK